jgi:hypothetical protein
MLMWRSSWVKENVSPLEQAIQIKSFLHAKKLKVSNVPSTWVNRPEGINIPSTRNSPLHVSKLWGFKSSLHGKKPGGSKIFFMWVKRLEDLNIPSTWTSLKAQKFLPREQARRFKISLHVSEQDRTPEHSLHMNKSEGSNSSFPVNKPEGSKFPFTWVNRTEDLNIPSTWTSLQAQKFPSHEQARRLGSSLHVNRPEGTKVSPIPETKSFAEHISSLERASCTALW